MTSTVHLLQEQFRHLRMVETADELPVLLRNAEKSSWTYQEFLQELLTHEMKKREEKSIQKRLKWAGFPYLKTLDEFNVEEQISLSKRQLNQLRQLNWLEQQYNLILLGPPGSGKTHITIGLGVRPFKKALKWRFQPWGNSHNY